MRFNKKDNKIWKIISHKIKEDADYKCRICGLKDGTLNKKGNKIWLHIHHITPINNLKFNAKNLICLCPSCHKFSLKRSPHKNPLAFFIWFQQNYPHNFEYLKKFL